MMRIPVLWTIGALLVVHGLYMQWMDNLYPRTIFVDLFFILLLTWFIYCIQSTVWFSEYTSTARFSNNQPLPQGLPAIERAFYASEQKELLSKLEEAQAESDQFRRKFHEQQSSYNKLNRSNKKLTQSYETARIDLENAKKSAREYWNRCRRYMSENANLQVEVKNLKSRIANSQQSSQQIALIAQPPLVSFSASPLAPTASTPASNPPLPAPIYTVLAPTTQVTNLQADFAQEQQAHQVTKSNLKIANDQLQLQLQQQAPAQTTSSALLQPNYEDYKAHAFALDRLRKEFFTTLQNKGLLGSTDDTSIEGFCAWIVETLPGMLDGYKSNLNTLIDVENDARTGYARLTNTVLDPAVKLNLHEFISDTVNWAVNLHQENIAFKNTPPQPAAASIPMQSVPTATLPTHTTAIPLFSQSPATSSLTETPEQKSVRFIKKHYDLYSQMVKAIIDMDESVDTSHSTYPEWTEKLQKSATSCKYGHKDKYVYQVSVDEVTRVGLRFETLLKYVEELFDTSDSASVDIVSGYKTLRKEFVQFVLYDKRIYDGNITAAQAAANAPSKR